MSRVSTSVGVWPLGRGETKLMPGGKEFEVLVSYSSFWDGE